MLNFHEFELSSGGIINHRKLNLRINTQIRLSKYKLILKDEKIKKYVKV